MLQLVKLVWDVVLWGWWRELPLAWIIEQVLLDPNIIIDCGLLDNVNLTVQVLLLSLTVQESKRLVGVKHLDVSWDALYLVVWMILLEELREVLFGTRPHKSARLFFLLMFNSFFLGGLSRGNREAAFVVVYTVLVLNKDAVGVTGRWRLRDRLLVDWHLGFLPTLLKEIHQSCSIWGLHCSTTNCPFIESS